MRRLSIADFKKMKIVVLGAGSLGSAIGGVLAESRHGGGNEVWLVNRSADHVEAIHKDGLRLVEGAQERVVPRAQVFAARHAREIDLRSGPVELVIVLVKSFHTREVIESALPVMGEHTTVLSLQNGLGHEDVLADVVGKARVLAGKTYVGGVLLAPGRVQIGVQGKETLIGELDGSTSQRVQRIASVFNQAGLATTVSQNILGTVWDKLFVNVATGALSAITRLPYGALYSVPEVETCAVAAVAEAMAVAKAAGIQVATTDPRAPWVKAAAGLSADFKASMLQSLEKGSVTEIDFVNGAVVEQGRKYGVPTPVNMTLVACVKGVERGLRK